MREKPESSQSIDKTDNENSHEQNGSLGIDRVDGGEIKDVAIVDGSDSEKPESSQRIDKTDNGNSHEQNGSLGIDRVDGGEIKDVAIVDGSDSEKPESSQRIDKTDNGNSHEQNGSLGIDRVDGGEIKDVAIVDGSDSEKPESSQSIDKTDNGDSYEQNGSLGIGRINGSEIKDEAIVAGISYKDSVINNINYNSPISPPDQPGNTSTGITPEKSLNSLLETVYTDRKYQDLVIFELEFLDENNCIKNHNVLVKLTISFGQAEEKLRLETGLFKSPKEIRVRFGIKYGKLHLKFTKGAMPLRKREPIEKGDWQVTITGENETPVWQFQCQDQQPILQGGCSNKRLGIADLSSVDCIVEGIFKIGIPTNDIVITSQDGLWTSQDRLTVQQTKSRWFFKKIIQPKLEDYLSKITLKINLPI